MDDNLKEFIQSELKNLIFKKVSFDEPLVSTKVLDSISLVDLIVAIEERLDVNIPTTDVNENNFDTINRMYEYLT